MALWAGAPGEGGRPLLGGTGGCSRLGTGAFIGGDCMLRTEQTTSGFDAQSHRTYTYTDAWRGLHRKTVAPMAVTL
jgi:hypothetical protein